MEEKTTTRQKVEPLYGCIGEVLRRLRVEKGVKLQTLADRVGIGHTAVWAIEKGYVRMQLHKLAGMSECYGWPLSLVIEQAEDMLRKQQAIDEESGA